MAFRGRKLFGAFKRNAPLFCSLLELGLDCGKNGCLLKHFFSFTPFLFPLFKNIFHNAKKETKTRELHVVQKLPDCKPEVLFKRGHLVNERDLGKFLGKTKTKFSTRILPKYERFQANNSWCSAWIERFLNRNDSVV